MPFAHRSRKCSRLDRMMQKHKRRHGLIPCPSQIDKMERDAKAARVVITTSEPRPEPIYLDTAVPPERPRVPASVVLTALAFLGTQID